MIKGNKKIPLYNKSSLFNKFIGEFLNHTFIETYKEKRKEKI